MLPFLCLMLEIPEIVFCLTKPDTAQSDTYSKLVEQCPHRDCSPQRCPPDKGLSRMGLCHGAVSGAKGVTSCWMVSEVALKGVT